jgi:hypothetical protein
MADRRKPAWLSNELLWARLGSNQRPLACEASALPLSYAPERVQRSAFPPAAILRSLLVATSCESSAKVAPGCGQRSSSATCHARRSRPGGASRGVHRRLARLDAPVHPRPRLASRCAGRNRGVRPRASSPRPVAQRPPSPGRLHRDVRRTAAHHRPGFCGGVPGSVGTTRGLAGAVGSSRGRRRCRWRSRRSQCADRGANGGGPARSRSSQARTSSS